MSPQLEDGRWGVATHQAADRLLEILHGDALDPTYNGALEFSVDDSFSFGTAKRPDYDSELTLMNPSGHGPHHHHQFTLQGSGFTSPVSYTDAISSPSSVGDASLYSSTSTGPHPAQGHAFPFPPAYSAGTTPQQYFAPGPSLYPPPPSTSTISAAGSPIGTSAQRPAKRPRESIDTHKLAPEPSAAAQKKVGKACQHCKRIKMKCIFKDGSQRCERCIKKSLSDCRVEERKRPQGPNVRERLLHEIRAKDQLIQALLRHIHDPHASSTPLGLLPSRIDPKSLTRTILLRTPDDTSEEDGPTRDRRSLVEQRAAAGTMLSLISQANGTTRAAQQWRAETTSSDDEDSNDSGDESDPVDPEQAAGEIARAAFHTIPSEQYPLGLLARMSFHETTPTRLEQAVSGIKTEDDPTTILDAVGGPSAGDNAEGGAEGESGASTEGGNDGANFGLENPRYFHPGPAANLPLRQIIIDKQISIEILDLGIVTLAQVDELFEIFYRTINPALSILDEALHTPSATRKRCPFLFTVICASAARWYTAKPELYPMLMQFAKKAAASALIDGWKSIELVQAYIILGDYAPSARKWEEDRSYLYKGLAIRIAMDLNLHLPPVKKADPTDERAVREERNRTRAWFICHNIDRSGSTQFGKAATLPLDDAVIRNSKEWYRGEFAHPFDVQLCGYVTLLRIMAQFHELVRERGSTSLNKNIDYLAVTRMFDDKLTAFREEWQERFDEVSDKNDPGSVLRCALLPMHVHYSKLIMYSFGFQYAFEKGLAASDPFFLRCWNAATGVVRVMADMGDKGYLKHSAECIYIFGTFASGFLFKLLRPEFAQMVDADQRKKILDLVSRFATVLEASAIDETHAPRLYGRFLHGLVRKHTAPSALVVTPATPPATERSPGRGTKRSDRRSMDKPSSQESATSKEGQPRRVAGQGRVRAAQGKAAVAQSATQDHPQVHSGDAQWVGQAQLPTPIEPTYNSLALNHVQQPMDTNQQWAFYPAAPATDYTAGMEVDEQILLPLRAIANPAFGQHMLLPGWQQQATMAVPAQPVDINAMYGMSYGQPQHQHPHTHTHTQQNQW